MSSELDQIAWDLTDTPATVDVAVVDGGLESANSAAADLTAVRRLACFARLSSGETIGGCIARTWGECCEIQQIWVASPNRRQGLGRRLIQIVESEARRRECTLIYLETFSFQALGFYSLLGFETLCEIRGFPGGVVKSVLRKGLMGDS